MLKMRKTVISSLCFILCLTMFLAGCSSKTGSSSTNSPVVSAAPTAPTATAAATAQRKLDPYKLTLVYPGGTPKDLKVVQDEMNKYLTDKINATIELMPIDWGAWGDKTNLMFTSGEPFDLIFAASWNGFNANVVKGQFIKMNDLLEKYGQGAKTALGQTWLDGGRINGITYALPTLKEFASTSGVVMRKDMIDKYKIDLTKINTLEDLEPALKAIKDGEPGLTPLLASDGQNLASQLRGQQFDTLGDNWGVIDRDSTELKVVDLYESPKYVNMIKLMRKWYTLGYINQDAANTKEDQLNNLMKAGKGFAMSSQLKPGKDAEMSTQLGVTLVQKEFIKPYTTTGDATGAMLAISRTSKNPERAMMFLNLLYTDKYLLNLLDNGVEGKHYVKKSDNVIDFPAGVTTQTSGYNIGNAWMFGNQSISYLFANEDPQKWEKFAAFNASSTKSLALGFVWDPENVKTEISAMENVKKQYGPTLDTGTIDPDSYIPKYVAKLKAAGLDKIIAEKQKQLDAWSKNKK